jgi:hypothetical protein
MKAAPVDERQRKFVLSGVAQCIGVFTAFLQGTTLSLNAHFGDRSRGGAAKRESLWRASST